MTHSPGFTQGWTVGFAAQQVRHAAEHWLLGMLKKHVVAAAPSALKANVATTMNCTRCCMLVDLGGHQR